MRIGNGAYNQHQHDVWGAMLDSIFLHAKSRDHLPERRWPLHQEPRRGRDRELAKPDQGIWEVRGEPQHFTSSKVMCWVACDRGARLAALREDHDAGRDLAREGRRDQGRHPRARLRGRACSRQHYDTDALDAVRAAASRSCASCRRPTSACARPCWRSPTSLTDRRARAALPASRRPTTASPGEEGTFTICSFWLVSALSEIGEHHLARDLCQKLLGYASPLHLYAEEIDPRSGRHLGNFPQAFTHLALINAVMHVIRADEKLAAGLQPLSAHDEPLVPEPVPVAAKKKKAA